MYMGTYPEPLKTMSGCKVAYLIYKTKREAIKAAEIAKIEAKSAWDYGYQIPGEITGTRGNWIVTIP